MISLIKQTQKVLQVYLITFNDLFNCRFNQTHAGSIKSMGWTLLTQLSMNLTNVWSATLHVNTGHPNTLVTSFPEGWWADVGEYRDFMGNLQQISVLGVGEMWGLFKCPSLGENVGNLLLFNWEEIENNRLFTRSMVRWRRKKKVHCMFLAQPHYTLVINQDKFRTAYKLLTIEKVQTFQPSRFDRETHGLGCQLTVSRFCLSVSRWISKP